MARRLFGFFSGFPTRHFTSAVTETLREEMTRRESLVFISAWPSEHAKNDEDRDGMHELFAEYDMPFARRYVIDDRTGASAAKDMISEASCVFLMGGHPGQQIALIREKGLAEAIRGAEGTVLGISAGAINMAKRSLDTKDSPIPYAGIGLADITIKPHFDPENRDVLAALLQISEELPIFAMEDESAIFVKGGEVAHAGRIHLVHKGKIRLVSPGTLSQALSAVREES